MDPLTQKLQVAQDLIKALLPLLPASAHAQAQTLLSAAQAKIQAIDAAVVASPLVAPTLVPPATAPSTPTQPATS